MEHIAAFLLIVGCSQDMVQCEELPAPEAVYETVQDCDAVLPSYTQRFKGAHPQLLAECFEVDPLLTEVDAEIVWEITKDGRLLATVEPIDDEDVNIASGAVSDEGLFATHHH